VELALGSSAAKDEVELALGVSHMKEEVELALGVSIMNEEVELALGVSYPICLRVIAEAAPMSANFILLNKV